MRIRVLVLLGVAWRAAAGQHCSQSVRSYPAAEFSCYTHIQYTSQLSWRVQQLMHLTENRPVSQWRWIWWTCSDVTRQHW